MLNRETPTVVATLDDLASLADYSLIDTLNCDPEGQGAHPRVHARWAPMCL